VSEGPILPSSDESSVAEEPGQKKSKRSFPLWATGRRVSTIAAALVLLLALGAVLWPGGQRQAFHGVCLVFDPCGGKARVASLYGPLTNFLVDSAEHSLDLIVVKTVADFQAQVADGVDFVVCPDGLGLALDPELFVPMVAGRRTAPRNLRPRSVVVYRLSAGLVQDPWSSHPAKTIFGDSLSLGATGILRVSDRGLAENDFPVACTSGPDCYDHSPALHALRLGGFDYAIVRQWDAERFFSEGLLPLADWGMEILTGPVPDTIVFASRRIPAAQLLDLSGELARLGRASGEESPEMLDLIRGLGNIHLSGFNLLVEPDLDQVRGSYPEDWPPAR
jgi:hypothetical protein